MFSYKYKMNNSLPLQVWLNNFNNTNNTNASRTNEDCIDYNLPKQYIIKHIKIYLIKNNIDYHYFAKSIYKNIINDCNLNNFDDLEIYNYLNKYHMNNQDFIINIILDLIQVNKNYDLYDFSKLNGIEKILVKNFSNDILKIMNEKKKTNTKSPFFTIEKKVMTLENNIKMLIDEINNINNNNNTLSKDLHTLHNNYKQLQFEFNDLNNNYMNLKVEFDGINYILNEIVNQDKNTDDIDNINININEDIDNINEDIDSYYQEQNNNQINQTNQTIDFVIKDVERIGDNVANELYKIMN
jgi:hypothetical protein